MKERSRLPDLAMGIFILGFVTVAAAMIFDDELQYMDNVYHELVDRVGELDAGKMVELGRQWQHSIASMKAFLR